MIVESSFRPPRWLRNPHLQTIVAGRLRPQPHVDIRRERIDLPDGDFIDADWQYPDKDDPASPVVVLIHGLGGSIESRYARGMMNAITDRGWRAVLMHLRGASGEPNRQPRGYHSGDTADLEFFVDLLREREPDTPLAAVGYSMGGNILLKLLGERGSDLPLTTGVAVSVPFDLALCAKAINSGFSRIYQSRLIASLRELAETKFRDMPAPIDIPDMRGLRDFYAFDDAVTAPLNGFASAQAYYDQCSSRQFLHAIQLPTLIIHAEDDPFMAPDVIPEEEELSDSVTLELSHYGGHVGFIAAAQGGRPVFWLEQRIPHWLDDYLKRDSQ